jgi:hypothetical protein
VLRIFLYHLVNGTYKNTEKMSTIFGTKDENL